MYKKIKKVINKARDFEIEAICEELINANDDTMFIISKKFILKKDKRLGKELDRVPVVVVTKPIEQLTIPSAYFLTSNNELTTWCDNNIILIKLIYSKVKFVDGEIKNKIIPNMYLDIENKEEVQKVLNYK